MSRNPRLAKLVEIIRGSDPTNPIRELYELASTLAEPKTIPTQPEDLTVGQRFMVGDAIAEVTGASGKGVTVHVTLGVGQDIFIPSAFHVDDLRERFPDGVPVLWEPKTFSGTVDIGDPLTLTIGQVTGLLPDVARNVGKVLPGERYRVTFERIVEE